MTTRDAARVGIRLLGFYAVVAALGQLPVAVLAFGGGVDANGGRCRWGAAVMLGAALVLSWAFAGSLLLGANRLAAWLFPASADRPDHAGPMDSREVQAVAFSVLGLYLVLTSLPAVLPSVWHLSEVVTAFRPAAPGGVVVSQALRMAGQIVEFVLGLVLVVQARGMARVWHALQGAGPRREGSSGRERLGDP
jgi:hypothetical protein